MTRYERLFFIMQLVKHQAPITVKQIACECGVSERTIYRDVVSLSQLNVPIFHDPGKGHRLANNVDLRFGEIRSDDAELIVFSLYHNPLIKSPFFKHRLMYLKEVLEQKFESSKAHKVENLFLYDATYKGFSEIHKENIIKFVFALFNQNYVSITDKRDFISTQLMVPIGIRFKGTCATFILYSEDSHSDCRIDIDDIEAISIASSRFTHRPNVDLRPYEVHEETV